MKISTQKGEHSCKMYGVVPQTKIGNFSNCTDKIAVIKSIKSMIYQTCPEEIVLQLIHQSKCYTAINAIYCEIINFV